MTTNVILKQNKARAEVMKAVLRVSAFDLLDEMFRVSPDPVLTIDSMGNIIMASKGMKSLVQEDFFGLKFKDILHPADVEKAMYAIGYGISSPIMFRLLCHDGSYVEVVAYYAAQNQDFTLMYMQPAGSESVSYKKDGVTFDRVDLNLWCIHACGETIKDQGPGRFILMRGTAEVEYQTLLGKIRKPLSQGEPFDTRKTSNVILDGMMVKMS